MRIVLVGGGLAHISFIRNLAQKLPATAEVVLVHTEPQVFYEPSFYSVLSQNMPVHSGFVDLRNLCTLMGVTFIQAEVDGLQLEDKMVRLKNRAGLQYDYLSLNGLELPDTLDAEGSQQAIVHVKDFSYFFKKLKETHEYLIKKRPTQLRVAVIGGGSVGVQVAQQCAARFKSLVHSFCVEIFEKQDVLLSRYSPSIRKHVEQELKAKDILFHTGFQVDSVRTLKIQENKKQGRFFEADLVLLTTGAQIPLWLKNSPFVFTPEGYLEAHKTGVLLSAPQISAYGMLVGHMNDVASAKIYAEALYLRATGSDLDKVPEQPKTPKKLDVYFAENELLTVNWGVLRKSQKQLAEQVQSMKQTLEHLRAVKEQKRVHFDPHVEDTELIESLKRRLLLDVSEAEVQNLFLDSIGDGCTVNTWLEKEYKDVFNDHFQSSYYSCVDLLEKSFLKQARPQYLRLHIAAPQHTKDVEILSQIIIGAVKASRQKIPLRLHVCSQSMNTVQLTMGMLMDQRAKYQPSQRSYIAVARPLGLYALLSQQANSDSVGQWLSAAREKLNSPMESLLDLPNVYKDKFAAFPLSEWGMMNDLVDFVGHDGWRVCVNLSQLPRWEGVDHIMKLHPHDSLVDRNWHKGFKFWPGQEAALPTSQYLLWEPHVLRASACFVIDPSVALELDQELRAKHGIEIDFVGYLEPVHHREQTHYKLSDWSLDTVSDDGFKSVSL